MKSTLLPIAACVATLAPHARAQNSVFLVSPSGDMVPGQSADSMPGLSGRFRQQILIGPSRLQGLTGKSLHGLWFRRTLTDNSALVGGTISLTIGLAHTATAPERASMAFEANAPATSQTEVFRGSVLVPHAPALGPTPAPWSRDNAFQVAFPTGFTYRGGTLVVDIAGGPASPGGPIAWYMDHELRPHDGTATTFGTSCSNYKLQGGLNLLAEDSGLQIGGTARIMAMGRPNTRPLLLLGITPIPTGVDLAPMGAPGCQQYLSIFSSLGLSYQPPIPGFDPVFTHLLLPVPFDTSLISAQITMQTADIETSLPTSSWSNVAGLTTSNGLTLRIASTQPTLDMSVVQSAAVDPGQAIPASGRVDVERAPVFRILYR